MSEVFTAPPAAPGEPRPPVIGMEASIERHEAELYPEKPPNVAMETPDTQTADVCKRVPASEPAAGAEAGCQSPPYTASSTPPYLRWANGLRSLLDDKEGVEHFKTYLKEEGCPEMLNFWFACEGLKHQTPDSVEFDPVQFRRLILAMYKRFIKNRRVNRHERESAELPVSEDVKSEIAERIKADRIDGRIFDSAQAQVEDAMNRTLYPNFLKSDYYIQLVQGSPTRGEPGVDGSQECSSCASSVCGAPGLPTLHEEHETGAQKQVAPLTRDALLATQERRAQIRPPSGARRRTDKGCPVSLMQRAGPGLPLPHPVNPYHTLYSSYNPVSRQDSELQSMSSEALTDDTNSRAGSSVDGRSGHYPTWLSQKRMLKWHNRQMKENARVNQESALQHTFIPRTQKPQVTQVDPAKNVQEFARLLTAKLEKVIVEREMMESGMDSKRLLQDAIGRLGKLSDENEQEILDAHISMVFDSSHQTPSRSGARSPAPPPPHLMAARRPPPPHSATSRRDRDVVSILSADSGNVNDLGTSQLSLEQQQQQRHQRHHVPKSRTFPDYGLPSANEGSVSCGSQRVAREVHRNMRQSFPDLDSGVSVVSSDVQLMATPPPSAQQPLDKVLLWMQQTEEGPSVGSTTSSGGRHRSSRASHALASPQPPARRPPLPQHHPLYQQGYRSGSLERADDEKLRPRTRLSEGQAPAGVYNSLKRHPRLPKPPPVSVRQEPEEMLCIAYTFCGEEVPYMTRLAGKQITLKQFKQLLPKKGNYRYYFKTECSDFETGVIQEEISEDNALLPLWEGKVHGQVMARE